MHNADLNSSAASNAWFARSGWIALVLGLVSGASWLVFGTSRSTPRAERSAERTAAHGSPQELAELKAAVGQLDRRSRALEAAALATEQPVAQRQESPPAAPEAPAVDPRSELEIQRDTLRELDVVLTTDPGDAQDRRSAADGFRRELVAAAGSRSQVLDVECATAFCKATLEEDTSLRPEMDTAALIDATPFLKREAMFDYEREGARKRTIIYAARDGRLLPIPREGVAPGDGVTGPE
jgi:hypothetical protein